MIAANGDWKGELLNRLHSLHSNVVSRGDELLDYASSVDLSTTTSGTESWRDEWSQFTAIGSWPEWPFYQQAMFDAFNDGVKGAKSVGYWIWLTIQPLVYSLAYIFGRLAQTLLGTFLPKIQYGAVEICRFHLHLTWYQAMGEIALVVLGVATWKLVRYLRRQQYLRRSQRFIRRTSQRITKSIQGAYREVADASLLLAMSLPHAAYFGVAICIRLAFPAWVNRLCMGRTAPNILKWYYPIFSSIAVLRHTRPKKAVDRTAGSENKRENNKDRKGLSSKEKDDKKTKTKKNRRRRSSIGSIDSLLRRNNEGAQAGGNEYTEQDIKEDVNYWLHFWLLYSTLEATYALATRVMFIRTILASKNVYAISCELELLFYMWIFIMPEMLIILFPSAGEENRRDWSPTKQWCYECALDPVLAIPSALKPTIIPFFEKVSHAVSSEDWKRLVVDKVQYLLGGAVMLRMISEETRDTLVACLQDFSTLVLPALTLLTPGFITQYGVWYVQFIVPQAHSLKALNRGHRHDQKRVLYLKFWVLHGFVAGLMGRFTSFLWWLPLFTHFTFVTWCVLVLPRCINAVYAEFDRELQAFGLLPRVEGDALAVEDTHTVRAFSILLKSLPSADDTDPNNKLADSEGAGAAAGAEKDVGDNGVDAREVDPDQKNRTDAKGGEKVAEDGSVIADKKHDVAQGETHGDEKKPEKEVRDTNSKGEADTKVNAPEEEDCTGETVTEVEENKKEDLSESLDVKDETFGRKADKENQVLSSATTKSTSKKNDSVGNNDSSKTAEQTAQGKKESVRRSTRTKRRPA
ncbi:expressed unknown protein [Seminavis robusta]|uniref:Uncharacterized protein n=1 Tax=Seminavis robusta TaxID=568900 RepID=A0A9N8DDX0_9STRA|nr:expressed unknown protein [Seminavis robusta]|eukprot:Sro78_g042310.1 n/a (804) ;mRNA; r:21328-24258